MEISEFIEKLGSTNPTPGGGAAAGLSVSLAAACVEKAVRFSKEEKVELRLEAFVKIRITGEKLCEEDQRYFLEWQEARKLPKNTEEEKEKRKEIVDKAAAACASVPYKVGKLAMILLDEIENFLPHCSPFLWSDLACAVVFAKGAFEASCFNIRINLPYIKEESFRKELESFLSEQYEEFFTLERTLLMRCEEKFFTNK